MVVYLPMKNCIRTKVYIDSLRVYQSNISLPYPLCRVWREVPITEEILQEIEKNANEKPK